MGENRKIYGLIGLARRAGKVSFGTESVQKVVKTGKAKLVLMANDISIRTKDFFEQLCNTYEVPIRIVANREELSKSIGQVNKAVIVIKDDNFAKELIKRIDGGEVIG